MTDYQTLGAMVYVSGSFAAFLGCMALVYWLWNRRQMRLGRARELVKEWRKECTDNDVACMRILHFLREDEGDSVQLFCDNPDPSSPDRNHAMECAGWWTNWEPKTFWGETFRAMLDRADAAKCAAMKQRGGAD